MARPNLETDLTLRTAKADKALAGVANKATQMFEQKGFKLNIKEANYPLGKITGDFTKFGDSLEAAASRVLAFTATTTAVYGLATAFSRLITDSIKLEKQLASIQSILQTSSSNLQKFSNELFGVANATGQAFDVAAEAASEFARQGLSLEDTLKATAAALTFAKIAGIDATQAVENLTASLNTFSNEALGYTDIVDTIVSLDNSFAISAAGIADGLKRVGSVASESGIELKEVASLISVVQQVSARGAPVISNGLKTIFTRLGRSGVQEALGNIGVATTDANGQFRDQIDVLTDLANKLDSLSDTQRAFILEQVGGVYQINTLQSTLKSLRGEYSLYDKAVKIAGESSGNAAQRLKILTDTTDAQFQKLKNNVTQFLAEAGKITVKPIVDDFIGIANSGFDNLLAGLGVGNKAQGKAEESGFSIGKALIGGIQSALQGPAIVLAIVTVTKLVNRLVQDVVTALKVLSGIKQASAIDSATQQTVNDAIRLGNKELVRRLSVTKDINEQTLILNALLRDAAQRQRALQVSALVATGLTKAGAKQATPNNATGYVPHFADPKSIEKAGAIQHGYKPGRVYKTRVHDGTGKSQLSYVNSAENVINFVNSNGKRATMVVPPNGFSKDTTYASTGFVPSFADSDERFSGVDIKRIKDDRPLRDSAGARLKRWARLDADSRIANLRFRDPDTGESTLFADVISDFNSAQNFSDAAAREYVDWLGRAAALNPSIRDVVDDIRYSVQRPNEQTALEGFAKPIKSSEKGSGYKATNILENLPLRKKYFNEGFVPNFAKDKAKAFPFGDFRTGVIDSTVTGNTAKIHMISSFDEGRGNSSKLYQGFFKKARKNNLTTVEGDLVAQDRKPRENTPLSKVLAKYPQLSRGKYSARSTLQVGDTLLEFGGGDSFYKDLEKNAEFILSNGPKFPNLPFKSYLFNGFVPNFAAKSSMIGEGSFGSFHRITDKIGVKHFKKDAFNTERERKEAVVNEFAMSKILAETPIVRGIRGVQIPDSIGRAVKSSSIRKEIATDPLAQEAVGMRSAFHLGQIMKQALKDKGLDMTDLHGNNYTLNEAAIQYVKKNEKYFKSRTRSGDKDFFEKLQSAGGILTILDPAEGTPESPELERKYFEALRPTRKNNSFGFVPSFASKPDKLLNIRGRSNSYLRYGDSEEGLYIADVNSSQKGDAFKMFSKLTELSSRVKKPIVSELLFQNTRGAREAQLRYEEGRGLKEVLQAHYPQLRYREIPNLQTSGSIRVSGSNEDFDFDSLDSMEKILPKLGRENIVEGNVDVGNLKSTYTGSYKDIRDFNKRNSGETFFSKDTVRRKRFQYNSGFVPNFAPPSGTNLIDFAGGVVKNKKAIDLFKTSLGGNVEVDDKLSTRGFVVEKIPVDVIGSQLYENLKINSKAAKLQFEKVALNYLNTKGYNFRPGSESEGGESSSVDGYSIDNLADKSISLLDAKGGGDWTPRGVANKFGRFVPENIQFLKVKADDLAKQGIVAPIDISKLFTEGVPDEFDIIKNRNVVAVPEVIGAKKGDKLGPKRDTTQKEKLFYSDDEITLEDIEDYRQKEEQRETRKQLRSQGIDPVAAAGLPEKPLSPRQKILQQRQSGDQGTLDILKRQLGIKASGFVPNFAARKKILSIDRGSVDESSYLKYKRDENEIDFGYVRSNRSGDAKDLVAKLLEISSKNKAGPLPIKIGPLLAQDTLLKKGKERGYSGFKLLRTTFPQLKITEQVEGITASGILFGTKEGKLSVEDFNSLEQLKELANQLDQIDEETRIGGLSMKFTGDLEALKKRNKDNKYIRSLRKDPIKIKRNPYSYSQGFVPNFAERRKQLLIDRGRYDRDSYLKYSRENSDRIHFDFVRSNRDGDARDLVAKLLEISTRTKKGPVPIDIGPLLPQDTLLQKGKERGYSGFKLLKTTFPQLKIAKTVPGITASGLLIGSKNGKRSNFDFNSLEQLEELANQLDQIDERTGIGGLSMTFTGDREQLIKRNKDSSYNRRLRQDSIKIKKNRFNQGFIPNFADPLKEAKEREMAAGYSKKEVKVAKSLSLVTPLNPQGLGVYNSDEGSLMKGMSLAKQAGIDPRSKGLKLSHGFVPNFATAPIRNRSAQQTAKPLTFVERLEDYNLNLEIDLADAIQKGDKALAASLAKTQKQAQAALRKATERAVRRANKPKQRSIFEEDRERFENQPAIERTKKEEKQSEFDRIRRGSNKPEDIQRRERLQGQALNFAFGLPAIVGAFAGPEGQRSETGKIAANAAESLGAGVSIASSLGFTPIGVAAGVLAGSFTMLSKVAEGTSLNLTSLESSLDAVTTENEKQVQSASVAASKRFELDDLRRSGASPDKIAKVESEFNKAVSKIKDDDIRNAVSTETDENKLNDLLSDFQTQKSNEVEFSKALLSLGTLSKAIDDKGIGKNPFGKNFFEKQREDFKPENFEAVFDPILNSIDGTALASDKGKEAIDQLRLGFVDLAGFFTQFGEELGLSKKNAQAAAEQFKNLNGRFNPESLQSFKDFIVAALQANNALTEQKPDLPELDTLTFDAARISKSIRESILTENSDKRFKRTATRSSKLNIEDQQLTFERNTDKISERDEIIKRGELEIRKRNLESEDKIGAVSDNAVKQLLTLTKDKNLTPEQDTKLSDAVVKFQQGGIDFTDLRNTLVETLGSGADQKTLGEIESLTRDTVSELNKILVTNQVSQEEITSLSKLQLAQLEAIAVNTVAKNVLSGEAQKARLQLKAEDPLAIAKINKDINKLKEKAEKATGSEKEKLNEQISAKEVERERIVERRRNLEIAAKGFSNLKPNEALLKEASERQANIDEFSKLVDALNKRRGELGNGQLFTKETKDKLIADIRQGNKDRAFETIVSKTSQIDSGITTKDPFMQELIAQIRDLSGFFTEQKKEPEVAEMASTDLQKFFRSASEFSARTPEAQKKALERYGEFKQDPTIQKYEQIRNEEKLSRERLTRLKTEEQNIAKAVLPDFSSLKQFDNEISVGYANNQKIENLEVNKGKVFLKNLRDSFLSGNLTQAGFREQLARKDIDPEDKKKAEELFAKTDLPTLTKKARNDQTAELEKKIEALRAEGEELYKTAKPIIENARGSISTPTMLETNFLSSSKDTAFLRDQLKDSGDPNLKELSDKLTQFLQVKADVETNKPELKAELTKMRNEVQQMLAQNAGPLSNLEEKVKDLYSPKSMGPQTETKGEAKKEEEPQIKTVEALDRLNANLAKQIEMSEKPKEVNSNIKQDISVDVSIDGASMTDEQRKEITRIINNEIQKVLRATKVENGRVTITTPPSAS